MGIEVAIGLAVAVLAAVFILSGFRFKSKDGGTPAAPEPKPGDTDTIS